MRNQIIHIDLNEFYKGVDCDWEFLPGECNFECRKCEHFEEYKEKMQWIITKEDITNGIFILEKERIYPLDYQNLFEGALSCFLSSSENFKKQMKVFTSFQNRNLNTPKSILHNFDQARKLIQKTRFPNQREKRLLAFAVWWLNSDLPLKILSDTQNGGQREVELRDQLAKEAPGFGMKCSSLLLIKCGYENVIPIDIWMLRYLKFLGYNVKIPDYRTISGITGKEYRKYEEILRNIALEHQLSPALFQAAIWSKKSAWSRNPVKPRQLFIEDFGGGLTG